MNKVIIVENLSKAYQLGQFNTGTLSNDIHRWWTIFRGKEDPYIKIGETNNRTEKGKSNIVWSLKDMSFEVEEGEAIGIVGKNGAGKSTLLKIISKVTSPTYGNIKIKGRITSLLEVGTGFHPELTGRENIYLNGAILGMRKNEISRKIDEIIDFSGVERYIDTPVKRYSSGMYVRLAFSVAAHLESQILIVDEVLAVGDAEFQKKCLGKINDVRKGQGKTVLFVSHNMTAIQNLCNRVLWINQGKIFEDGETEKVVLNYLDRSSISLNTENSWNEANYPGNEAVKLKSAYLRPINTSEYGTITVKSTIGIEVEFINLIENSCLHIGLRFYDQNGSLVFATHPLHEKIWHGKPFPKGTFKSTCIIPDNLLNDNIYNVTLVVVKNENEELYIHENIFHFQISDAGYRGDSYGKWPGAIRPQLLWSTEIIN
jgi:lipopolysaccharide transport system ATP-binding protein